MTQTISGGYSHHSSSDSAPAVPRSVTRMCDKSDICDQSPTRLRADVRLSLATIIWSFPLAFLLHDLGEVATMERWARANRPLLQRLPRRLATLVDVTTAQVAVAVGCEFLIVGAMTAQAARAPRRVGG